MAGTSFSSCPNAPGAPSGQRGNGSLISACIETENATSAARSELVFMARVIGCFVSVAELNESPVAFNEEVRRAMPSGVNLILHESRRSQRRTPHYAMKMRQSPVHCTNRSHKQTGMADVRTLRSDDHISRSDGFHVALLAEDLFECIIVGFQARQIPASWHRSSESTFSGHSSDDEFLKILFFLIGRRTDFNCRRAARCIAQTIRITRRP